MPDFPITGGHTLDIEFAPDIFLVGIRSPDGKCQNWERSEEWEDDIDVLRQMVTGKLLITFNGLNFDFPLLCHVLTEELTDPAEIYEYGSKLITARDDKQARQTAYRYRLKYSHIEGVDHIDLFALSGGKGLKTLALRMELPSLQSFDFTPNAVIGVRDYERLRRYNISDLDVTAALYERHNESLQTRQLASIKYSTDLRSKGDSQLGEFVILHEYEARTGSTSADVRASRLGGVTVPKFVPSWLGSIKHPAILEWYSSIPAHIPIEKVELGKAVTRSLFIGDRYFKTGSGGLHSIDDPGTWCVDWYKGPVALMELDVASFYPSLMITEGLAPKLSNVNGIPKKHDTTLISIPTNVYQKGLTEMNGRENPTYFT